MPTESLLPSHAHPSEKECYTCKRLLPASAYYKCNTTKYYRCKACEKVRLKQYRNSIRQLEEAVTEFADVRCSACKEMIPFNRLAKTGKFRNSICKPCYNKIKFHTRSHKAELVNGRGPCTRCELYGPSNKCIRPRKVDLDDSF